MVTVLFGQQGSLLHGRSNRLEDCDIRAKLVLMLAFKLGLNSSESTLPDVLVCSLSLIDRSSAGPLQRCQRTQLSSDWLIIAGHVVRWDSQIDPTSLPCSLGGKW